MKDLFVSYSHSKGFGNHLFKVNDPDLSWQGIKEIEKQIEQQKPSLGKIIILFYKELSK